jgi:hypothetical protein
VVVELIIWAVEAEAAEQFRLRLLRASNFLVRSMQTADKVP